MVLLPRLLAALGFMLCKSETLVLRTSKNMAMTTRDRFGVDCYDLPLGMAQDFVRRVAGVQICCVGTFYVEQRRGRYRKQ